MRRDSNLLCRHALVAALMIISGGCSADSAPTPVAASGDEPAQLVTLSDREASEFFAGLNPAVPVVVAGADEGRRVFAIVYDPDPGEAERLRRELIVGDDIQGCDDREGAVDCCVPATETLAVNTADGWVDTGESCEPAPTDVDAGVNFVEVPVVVSEVLYNRFGIDYPFLQLAEEDGTARALFVPSLRNPPSQSGELWLPPAMQRSGHRASSPIILASHKRPTPSDYCEDTITRCPATGYCRATWLHKYYKDRNTGEWCEMVTKCTCP